MVISRTMFQLLCPLIMVTDTRMFLPIVRFSFKHTHMPLSLSLTHTDRVGCLPNCDFTFEIMFNIVMFQLPTGLLFSVLTLCECTKVVCR